MGDLATLTPGSADGNHLGRENAPVESVQPEIKERRARLAQARTWLRTCWPVPFRPWVTGRQVGVLYSTAVFVISLTVAIQPPHRLHELIEQSSTNLANMAAQPAAVLFLSAFVVSPAIGLVLLIPLIILYGEVQRWLGAVATVVVIVFGHVGATLMVMTLEITALHWHLVGFRVAVRPDVGVSYGLFCALGVLTHRVPPGWRWPYAIGCLIVLGVLLLTALDFTNLGHLSAWLIGISLAWLLHASARAGRAEV